MIRTTIGNVGVWTLDQARTRAREIQLMLDAGKDPREARAEAVKQEVKKRDERLAGEVTFGEAWNRYLEGSQKFWSERHYQDHLAMTYRGGEKRSRSTKKTVAGPLAVFLDQQLVSLTSALVEKWAEREGAIRPARARLAHRLLRAFLNWCSEEPEFAALLDSNPAVGKRVRRQLGKPSKSNDTLLRMHLPGWFQAVRAIENPTISAYLQAVLLTGARPGEVRELKWAGVRADGAPPTLTFGDKNKRREREDNPTRTIGLSPYVAQLLEGVLRIPNNPYVFASPTAKGKPISIPAALHAEACKKSGGWHVSLKGLRATFKSLTEWRGDGDLDVSPGLVGQIMGHQPRQTAEAHYTQRPLDMLFRAQCQIEAWILREAGVQFATGKLPEGQ